MNSNQKSVKFLLKKIQDLQAQIAQMKNESVQKSRFNRKLCSQNRKRRLKNRDLLQQQQSKLSMIQNLKSKQEQYNNILNNYTKALDESNKKLDELQEQILVLKTQITKEKQINYNQEVQIRGLKEKVQRKDREIERYTFIQKEIMQKKHKIETRQPSTSQDQVIVLLCKNDGLQSKIKELQKMITGFLNKIEISEERIKELLDEMQSTKAILGMLNKEHEEEISQLNSKISQVYNFKQDKNVKILPSDNLKTGKEQSLLNVIAQSLLNVITKTDEQNLSIAYGRRMQYRDGQYFSSQNILYDGGIIQNYMNRSIFLHLCEPIKNNIAGTWFARIKLTGYKEIYFGISNQIINQGVQSYNRHFLFYNNCSGLIVIDKLGKFIDKYCTKNETITMKISITSNEKVISFFMNDIEAYKGVIPAELSKGDSFYPFVRLLGDMSVILR